MAKIQMAIRIFAVPLVAVALWATWAVLASDVNAALPPGKRLQQTCAGVRIRKRLDS